MRPLCSRVSLHASFCFLLLCLPCGTLHAQRPTDAIAPVRVGDQVEVQWFRTWYPGTVQSYSAGTVTVEYDRGGQITSGEFTLEDTRFPNGEGAWMVWKDSSGKFGVEARYVSRTETEVKIRKADGSEMTIPIDKLSSDLRKQVLKVPVTGNENMIDGANPVRVGDRIEIQYFSKWYPGIVKRVLPGQVEVAYDYGSFEKEGTFPLAEIRFPNGEGRWRLWTDASEKFKVVARYISRTQDKVTIRKEDGSDVTIPIALLSPSLRSLLAKTPITGEENKLDGANPVRVGDQIQVKYWFQWYDAVVTRVLPGEVEAQFKRHNRDLTERIKLTDIRFPNGEGRWREWSDASGSFTVIARFISRDETHVTIRKEDGTDARVEIAKLNPTLRRLLAETPIITPRPRNFDFQSPRQEFEVSAQTPDLEQLVISASATTQPVFGTGGTGFPISKSDSVSAAIPVGGEAQWVAVGAFSKNSSRSGGETRLYWASPKTKAVVEGPVFLDDERIVDYSAQQSRLLSVQVGGYWSQPIRFCTYRVGVGETTARAEASWEIPESKGSFGRRSQYMAKLIGGSRLLLGNDASVSLYDFSTRDIVYSISGVYENRFYLHPSGEFFAVMDNSGGVGVFEIDSGRQLAYRGGGRTYGSGVGFSQDGRHLLTVSGSEISIWDLFEGGPAQTLRQGGLAVGPGTPITLLSGGWISAGSQIYSTGLKLVVWNYVGKGVSIADRQMLGRQMLVAATTNVSGQAHALVGAATVPHKDAIELMKKVDPESLVMLKPGLGVRIEASGDSRIAQGLRRAAAARGFREDPSSEVILSGSAGPGKPEKRTYQLTSFGRIGGRQTEEHTVTPWIQKAEIRYRDQSAWGTQHGGVPYFVSFKEGGSLGAELQKSSQSSYDMFNDLKLPEELLYPRYQHGLGTTEITVNGFVDKAN
ncbi:SHD1 domain-containing protein [Stieleria sp. ICT_E10.1]|uniref:SHD1 domain-containing protein n=1 Tax=Stieleria sedimenti TaxID=2976331 RepID=UPI0021801F6A|nr:SHD1 domain-containing protein [Stieleria sedimenti]MCS7466745.1 SHD1 domain-containing protein [Stieleria sedimenti]